jgi:hypothetical protein
MRKAALAMAATYSWDAYVNKMEAAFKSLVGEIPSPIPREFPSPLAGEGQGGGSEKAA